jgi:nitronate monooxygenase
MMCEECGFDAVVVQGSEAGGHRGSFIGEVEESLIGLMALIPQTVDKVTIPVIAAGGIMDGRGIVAANVLGAKGVQMGTAFVTCLESGAHPIYKEAILHATEDETVLTKAFSGKSARGIQNDFIKEMKKYELQLPPYPIQNSLTKEIRKSAAGANKREYMSLWSGQSPRLSKNQPVAELFQRILTEIIELKKSQGLKFM